MGQEKNLTEAGEIVIRENYQRAILENKIEAISQPEIEILEEEIKKEMDKISRNYSDLERTRTIDLTKIKE